MTWIDVQWAYTGNNKIEFNLYFFNNRSGGVVKMIKEIIELFFRSKDKKNYDSLRDERIYIRVTKDEKELIKKLANCQCLNVSDFVRWIVFSKYINDFIK